MDNITHSLVGGLLAQTRLGKRLPYAAPVMIVAANLPDMDVISGRGGAAAFFEYHRGISHSIVGIILLAIIFGGICFAAIKYFPRFKEYSPPGFGTVFWPILAALITHPILDWTNNYGIRPWLPFSNRWYYGDIVVVIDPWLWLMLGGGLFLIASKTRIGISAWAILTGILSLVVLTGATGRVVVPAFAKVIWVAGIVVIIALRIVGGNGNRKPIAVFALSLMLIYWGALFSIHAIAIRHSTMTANWSGQPMKVNAYPMPTDPTHWMCSGETSDAIYQVYASAFRGADWSKATRLPKEATPDMISKIASLENGESFLSFVRSYSSIVKKNSSGFTVELRDSRFGLAILAKFDQDSRIVSVDFI